MKTLLLSSSYFPIRVIDWDRAVKMRYEGTVDVVAEYQDMVCSPSVSWRIPAVVRQHKPVKVRNIIRFSPANVFLRDRHRCQYCGNHFDAKQLEYDHVVPRANGGQTTWENIVSSCRACNAYKGRRECDEIGMYPINKPVRPTSLPRRMPNIDREKAPVEWLAYLPAMPA